jgi:hypothetical protein
MVFIAIDEARAHDTRESARAWLFPSQHIHRDDADKVG